jgi:2-iminobutanoate/2-iminopropanoate deaminase
MEPVFTKEAPVPAGHYAQGIVHGGLVYVSGQLPIDPATGEKILGPVEAQARRAFGNLQAVLEAAGSRKELVLRTTVYVPDVGLWPAVNAVYAEFFGDHRPARTVVPTSALHYGFLVEVDAVAAVE